MPSAKRIGKTSKKSENPRAFHKSSSSQRNLAPQASSSTSRNMTTPSTSSASKPSTSALNFTLFLDSLRATQQQQPLNLSDSSDSLSSDSKSENGEKKNPPTNTPEKYTEPKQPEGYKPSMSPLLNKIPKMVPTPSKDDDHSLAKIKSKDIEDRIRLQLEMNRQRSTLLTFTLS
jgi:hypothetical protein